MFKKHISQYKGTVLSLKKKVSHKHFTTLMIRDKIKLLYTITYCPQLQAMQLFAMPLTACADCMNGCAAAPRSEAFNSA